MTKLERLVYWLTTDRGYRDVWLLLITVIALIAVKGNGDRVTEIQASRIEQTQASCAKSNESSASLNAVIDTLQDILLSSALFPGDKPSPAGPDKMKWKTVQPGPFSQQLARALPGLPDATTRLRDAQANAKKLEVKRVTPRNCKREVVLLRAGAPPDTPTPTP